MSSPSGSSLSFSFETLQGRIIVPIPSPVLFAAKQTKQKRCLVFCKHFVFELSSREAYNCLHISERSISHPGGHLLCFLHSTQYQWLKWQQASSLSSKRAIIQSERTGLEHCKGSKNVKWQLLMWEILITRHLDCLPYAMGDAQHT